MTCGRRGMCSPRDTVNRHTRRHGNHFSWPNAIGKLHMSLPSLLPSFLLDLFLPAVWGHYGVYDLNTLFKSLLFVALALFWCICLPVWEISYQDMHFKMVYLCVGQAEINSRNVRACPICGSSDASSSSARFPACPIITNIFHRAPSQTNTLRGSSTRVASCHEEVWGWSWSAVTLHLTDVLTDSLLHVGWSSSRCQSQIKRRMMTECELTRTLPVSVWADIMTPAQSLTEVIQPTSLAAASSLSARLMPSPVVIRWTSW